METEPPEKKPGRISCSTRSTRNIHGQSGWRFRTVPTLIGQPIAFFILVLLIPWLMQGCERGPAPPLRVGSNVWPGYETLSLARSLGIFASTPIKLVELPSATEVTHAFRNGGLEVAALTLDEALALLQQDTSLRVILVVDVSNGGDAVLARPEITSLAQLKNRRIGVENSAVGAIMLDGLLTTAKLSYSDFTLLPVTVDEHLAAYRSGKVDAIVTFAPLIGKLLALGANNIFDSSQIPGRIVDVLVTRKTVLDNQKESLKTLLSAYFMALEYRQQHPDTASRLLAPRLAVPPAEVWKHYQGLRLPDLAENHRLLAQRDPELQKTAAELAQLMHSRHLLSRPVDTSQFIDGSLLPALR